MYTAELKGKDCRICQDWSDVSLSKAIELNKVVYDMPDLLEKIYLEQDEKKRLKLVEQAEKEGCFIKSFPVFYGKVINILTDIDTETLLADERSQLYTSFLNKFVRDIYQGFSDDRHSGQSFSWGEVAIDEKGFYIRKDGKHDISNVQTFLYPATDIKIGVSVPFSNETAGTFAESSDLMLASHKLKQGKYDAVKNIISILCRKPEEKYNETEMLKRADLFDTLPMTVVWQVFFYINIATITFANATASYLKSKEVLKLIKQRSTGQQT